MKLFARFLGVGVAGLVVLTGCSGSDGGKAGKADSSTSDNEETTASGPACTARAADFGYAATQQDTTCGDSNGATSTSVEMFSVDSCKQNFCLGYVNVPAGKTTRVEDLLEGCEGTVTISADNCTSEFSYSCDVKSLYGMVDGTTTVQYVGTVHWKADGKGGEGSLEETFFGAQGSSICSKDFALDISKDDGSGVTSPIPGAPGVPSGG